MIKAMRHIITKRFMKSVDNSIWKSIITVIILPILVTAIDAELTLFICGIDVCNRYNKSQFCSVDRCLDCDGAIEHCNTWKMPGNCSEFCFDLKLKQLIDTTCPLPWGISNGSVLAPTSTNGRYPPGTDLTFICNEGFHLLGTESFHCNAQGQWSPDTAAPYCIQVTEAPPLTETLSGDSELIIIIIVFGVLLFIACAGLVLLLTCALARKSKKSKTNANDTTKDDNPGTEEEKIELLPDQPEDDIENEIPRDDPAVNVEGSASGEPSGKGVVENVNVNGNGQYNNTGPYTDEPHGELNSDYRTDNTDVKIGMPNCESLDKPESLIPAIVPSVSPPGAEKPSVTTEAVQVEDKDNIKGKGVLPMKPTTVPVPEGSEDVNRKLALHSATIDHGDINNMTL